MALQVWLPLNKNEIKNLGYENPAITITGTLTYADGKLGKCLTLQGSNSIYVKIPYTNIGTEMSVCCWVKANSPNNWSDIFSFGNNNRIEKSTSTQYYYYADSNSLITSGAALFTMNDAVWTHIAMTVDGTNVKFYINGTLFGTYSQINTLSTAFGSNKFFVIGMRTGLNNPYKGYMNDFRIYDHALSPKEVKEINKGLILHYKLDGNDIGITIPRNGDLIPDGVELYDYILSSGTLYLDSGIVANQYPIELKTNLCYTDNATSEKDFFGNFSGGNSSTCFVCGKANSNKFYQWGGSVFYAGSVVLNLFYELSFNYTGASGRTLTIDGTANTSTANNGFTSRTDTIGVFSGASTRAYCAASVKMKYAQIKINNVVVRNFIPCTYLGEPGMWDTVENKFYRNQGTGLFTLGNKITLKEYEYLLSDASSWINSGFIPSSNTNSYVRYMLTGGSGSAAIFGEDTTWLKQNYTLWSRHGFTFGTQDPAGFTSSNNVEYTHELKNKQWFVNGTLRYTFTDTFQAIYPIHIFGNSRGNNAASERFVGNLYELKFWESGALVRDFIPVSYNGTPGLWDKVEWKFYANAGSGSFTLGPEKTVQQDAPIFYDSSGYCNHGSITGTLTTNNDSPRYTKSTRFSNLNCKITCVNEINLQKEFSLSCWFKLNSIPSNEVTIMNLYRGGAEGRVLINKLTNLDHICLWVGGGSNSSSAQINSTTVLATNTWYHVVGTKDKNNRLHIFINGEELNTGITATQSYGGATCNPSVGALNPTSSYNCDYYIADARVYCTALSEDDIKELYNTSAFVTDNGVFAEYELYEDNLSDVKKTGLLETANFYENGAESGYALDTDKTRVASNYIISEDFIEI